MFPFGDVIMSFGQQRHMVIVEFKRILSPSCIYNMNLYICKTASLYQNSPRMGKVLILATSNTANNSFVKTTIFHSTGTYQLQQILHRNSNFNGDIRSSVIPRYRPFVVAGGIQQILQQPSLVHHAGCVISTCKWSCLKPLGTMTVISQTTIPKCIFMNEKFRMLIPKFVPNG